MSAGIQALMSTPPVCFEHPGDVSCQLWGGRDMHVFTLSVLPTHPKQVPVMKKNVYVQGR